jgi:hypothetical protein
MFSTNPISLLGIQTREWELDFAFVKEKIGIELQGHGRGHTSYQGMLRDVSKHNDLYLEGWTVIYFMSVHLESPSYMFNVLASALKRNGTRLTNFHDRPQPKPVSGNSALLEAARRLSTKRPD